MIDGLDEGLYTVGIASPAHLYAESEAVELRCGTPTPDLRVELDQGHLLAGIVVSKHDGRPVAHATVKLLSVLEAPPALRASRRSLYPWVFDPGGLRGYVWVLPDAREASEDPYEYRRAHRTHRIRVRGGAFEDQGLTPGPAILVTDLRDRGRVTTRVIIPARDTLELDLAVPGREN